MNNNNQLIIVLIVFLLVASALVFSLKKDSKKPFIQKPPPQYIQPKPDMPIPPKPDPKPDKIEPEWVKYPPVRSLNDSSLGKILTDIDSHMPAGHIYKDADKITWGHETTHGINSNMRMKFSEGGKVMIKEIDGLPVFHNGKINAFYCLEDKGAIINEPPVHMRQAAALVPQKLRGPVYNLYMVQQAGSWGDTPLYIFDEWSAYTNGTEVRIDLKIPTRAETVTQMIEFDIYSICLAMAVKQNASSYDDRQFKAFLMWQLERTFRLHQGEANAYLEIFRTSSEAESLRKFCKEYFGEEWSKRTLKI